MQWTHTLEPKPTKKKAAGSNYIFGVSYISTRRLQIFESIKNFPFWYELQQLRKYLNIQEKEVLLFS